MRFLHPEHDEMLELALQDVFLLPAKFEGTSRLDVDLTPQDFAGGSHPVVTANMNAVTGKRMAETVARFGGLGVLCLDATSMTTLAVPLDASGEASFILPVPVSLQGITVYAQAFALDLSNALSVRFGF